MTDAQEKTKVEWKKIIPWDMKRGGDSPYPTWETWVGGCSVSISQGCDRDPDHWVMNARRLGVKDMDLFDKGQHIEPVQEYALKLAYRNAVTRAEELCMFRDALEVHQ